MFEENGKTIDDDEMVVLTMDDLSHNVSEADAKARGDFPDDLETPVEVVLDEDKDEDDEPAADDKDESEEDDGDAGEEAEEEEAEEEPKKGAPPASVPYGRLAKVISEKAALEERIAALEERLRPQPAQQQAPAPVQEQAPVFDLQAKYKEYANLIADGEVDEASELMGEIKKHEESAIEERILSRITANETKREAQQVVDQILTDNQAFFTDPINLATFNAAKEAYIGQGMSLANALQAASARFFVAEPVKISEEDEQASLLAEKKADLKSKAVSRNAAAANAQPARLDAGKGARTGPQFKPNALELSETEFTKMSDKEKRAARGDFV